MFFRWNIWGLKETQSTAFVEVVFVERALIQLTERLNRSLLLGLKATERCQERMRRGLEGFSLCALCPGPFGSDPSLGKNTFFLTKMRHFSSYNHLLSDSVHHYR